MVKRFKRLLRRLFCRTTTLKFYYNRRERANEVANDLTVHFMIHKNEYEVLKYKIYDCSPASSSEFIWCVMFKLLELDQNNNNLAEFMNSLKDVVKR